MGDKDVATLSIHFNHEVGERATLHMLTFITAQLAHQLCSKVDGNRYTTQVGATEKNA